MSSPNSTPLPDEKFDELEGVLNNTIHELVFLVNFLENGDFEAARDALMTAQMNLENVAEAVHAHIDDGEDEA